MKSDTIKNGIPFNLCWHLLFRPAWSFGCFRFLSTSRLCQWLREVTGPVSNWDWSLLQSSIRRCVWYWDWWWMPGRGKMNIRQMLFCPVLRWWIAHFRLEEDLCEVFKQSHPPSTVRMGILFASLFVEKNQGDRTDRSCGCRVNPVYLKYRYVFSFYSDSGFYTVRPVR